MAELKTVQKKDLEKMSIDEVVKTIANAGFSSAKAMKVLRDRCGGDFSKLALNNDGKVMVELINPRTANGTRKYTSDIYVQSTDDLTDSRKLKATVQARYADLAVAESVAESRVAESEARVAELLERKEKLESFVYAKERIIRRKNEELKEAERANNEYRQDVEEAYSGLKAQYKAQLGDKDEKIGMLQQDVEKSRKSGKTKGKIIKFVSAALVVATLAAGAFGIMTGKKRKQVEKVKADNQIVMTINDDLSSQIRDLQAKIDAGSDNCSAETRIAFAKLLEVLGKSSLDENDVDLIKNAIAETEENVKVDAEINKILAEDNLSLADFGSREDAIKYIQEKNLKIALDRDKALADREQAVEDLVKADDLIKDLQEKDKQKQDKIDQMQKELDQIKGSTNDAGEVSDKGNDAGKSDTIGPVSDNTNSEQKENASQGTNKTPGGGRPGSSSDDSELSGSQPIN